MGRFMASPIGSINQELAHITQELKRLKPVEGEWHPRLVEHLFPRV